MVSTYNISRPIHYEQPLLTWLPPPSCLMGMAPERGICLFRKEENYQLRIIDHLFYKVIKEISLDLPQELAQQPEDIVVNYLKKFTVSEESELEITEKLSGYPGKSHGHQELSLRSSKGRILWFLNDSSKNSVSWLIVPPGYAEIVRTIPEIERGTFFDNYGVEITAREDGQLQDVYLRNACAKSKLDPTKTLDDYFWAITLISAGSSSETDTGCGHAQIIYEIFCRGIHSLFCAHLTTVGALPGRAKVEIKKLPRITWRKKSPTWIRPRTDVGSMIEMLHRDKGTLIQFIHTGNPMFFKYLLSQSRYLAERTLIFYAILVLVSVTVSIRFNKVIQKEWHFHREFDRKFALRYPSLVLHYPSVGSHIPTFGKWLITRANWEKELASLFSAPLQEGIRKYLKLLPLKLLCTGIFSGGASALHLVQEIILPTSSTSKPAEPQPLSFLPTRSSLLEFLALSTLKYVWDILTSSPQSLLNYKQLIPPSVEEREQYFVGDSYNCLTWAVKRIRSAGVGLPMIRDTIAVPDSYVQSLSSLTSENIS